MIPEFLLSKHCEVRRIMNGVVAGTSDQTSSAINMAGFDGALIIAGFGALTSTQVTSMKLQQSSDDGSTDAYNDLTGSSTAALADADGNKLLMIDIFRPEKGYLKAVIDRGTANAVIDFMIVILYRGRDLPITQGSTVKELKTLITPAEGTA